MTNTLSLTEKLGETLFPALRERRNLLEREMETDRLTGLANRVAFEKAEPEALRENQAFILFDANNFGLVNKTCGHRRGDQLLQIFARVIAEAARNFKCRAFRIGGDEFLVICSPQFASAIRRTIETRIRPERFGDFVVSISGEIGTSVEDADSRLQKRKAEMKKVR